ncbi:DNA-3-methyladenine glycosylase [Patescibacteria group bacterium]
MAKIPRSFYNHSTLKVAQELLGQLLVRPAYPRPRRGSAGKKSALQKFVITETEAYVGQDDPACHACRGETPRNKIMFGPPGHAYVYFIYGMYHCLNIVTEKEGFPAAVLIRAVVPTTNNKQLMTNLDGPGKLCRELKIDKKLNGVDVVRSDKLWVERAKRKGKIKKSPRVGIKAGRDKLWRFNLEC